jgi:proteasome lid subunit RPN8/RPN11
MTVLVKYYRSPVALPGSLARMRIPRAIYDQMVAHARAEAPNECCGMVGGLDGAAATFYPARNSFESPMRFEIDSGDQLRITNEIEAAGEQLLAVYHSHPKTEAAPSQTDVNLAAWWPGVVWVIASLAGDEPVLRAFTIDGAEVEEVELVVG